MLTFFKLPFNVKLIYSIQVLGPWLWGNGPFLFFSGGALKNALRTANQGRATANSHAHASSFDLGLGIEKTPMQTFASGLSSTLILTVAHPCMTLNLLSS
jgi:hypothetical protein